MDEVVCTLLFLCLLTYEAKCTEIEPQCSKFDFEEKVLEKQVKIEHKMGLIMNSINDIQTRVAEDIAKMWNDLERKRTSSVYTRWGRTECSGNGTEMVYRGYIGGGHVHKGGAANILCLPHNPTWANYDVALNSHRGYIYGTEIDILPEAASVKMFGYGANEIDLPCAVCQTGFSVTHMFPGRASCFPGWVLQYTGYLVAEHNTHSSSKNYECLDAAPEAVPKGNSNDDQSVLYLVEAKCGSLPCPPYAEGKEIACAVCSK